MPSNSEESLRNNKNSFSYFRQLFHQDLLGPPVIFAQSQAAGVRQRAYIAGSNYANAIAGQFMQTSCVDNLKGIFHHPFLLFSMTDAINELSVCSVV